MKRGTRLLMLIATFAVVITGYVIVSRFTAEEADDNGAPENGTGQETTIVSIKQESVNGLEWTYEGETVSIGKSAGMWKYIKDEELPVDQKIVASMLGAVSEIKASRSIGSVDDLSEYGLEKPGRVVKVRYSDDGLITLHIGDRNDVTNEYYLMTDKDTSVFMVGGTLPSSFSYTHMDIVQKEEIPYMSSVSSFTVQSPDSFDRIVYLKSSEGITYTDVYKWFYEVEGEGGKGYSPLSTEKVLNLQSKITGLEWNSCADYSADAEELAGYGLAEPRISVAVEYTGGSGGASSKFELLLGDRTGGDECYAMLKGSKMVYLIDSGIADALLGCDYKTLRPDDVCLMDWNTVESMEVAVDGSEVTIDFSRGDEGMTFLVNGSEAEPEKIAALLNAINGLDAVDDTESTGTGLEPEVTIVLKRNTKYFNNIALKLTKYDSSHYLVSFMGQSRLLVANSDVSALKTAFRELAGL